LEVKPIVSEEQRKYIVQANSFNEQKAYNIAIDLYMKATEIDQTSYPAAYYNLALLSINVNQFYGAIFYMKKYLMLVPDAEDARAAQDKIYEWETIIEKGKYN
jgi:tetratricopeptide (TPR) repeat protein